MSKIRKHFTINKNFLDIVKEHQESNNFKSESEALENILKEYKSKNDTTTEMMIKIIANEVAKELKGELTTLKNTVRFTDTNTQVILEMINGLFIKNDIGDIFTTEDFKSDGLVVAESFIKRKIVKNTVRRNCNGK